MFRSWPQDDRDHALAWLLDERSKLPCGCYPDETVGPEHADKWTAELIVCEKHRSMGEQAEAWMRDATPMVDPTHGVLWTATRDDD